MDETPLPQKKHMTSQEDDEALLEDFPMICAPVHMDYGYNVKYVSPTTTYGQFIVSMQTRDST